MVVLNVEAGDFTIIISDWPMRYVVFDMKLLQEDITSIAFI